MARLTPSGVQESDEIYLLSAAGGNVKIRDGLMDIKELREVNADGLEQWTPVMKAGFPLRRRCGEGARVAAAAVPAPCATATRSTSSSKRLPAPGGAIRVVDVHKRRARYTVGGCMAELSDVVANGKPTRTIAVESEDRGCGDTRGRGNSAWAATRTPAIPAAWPPCSMTTRSATP